MNIKIIARPFSFHRKSVKVAQPIISRLYSFPFDNKLKLKFSVMNGTLLIFKVKNSCWMVW